MHTRQLTAVTLLGGALFVVAVLTACHRREHVDTLRCPAGDTLIGAPPPRGSELFCQKTVGGKPVKDGPFLVYATGGGKLIEGSYHDGAQEGRWTTWYENGQRSATDNYHDGLQNGLHTSWYANGQKAIEGNYRAGKRDGVWTRWAPSGVTSRQETYRDDKVVR